MKLYYSPGACSLAPHSVLREAGIAAERVKVDMATRRTDDGGGFRLLSPNGYVPALEIEPANGTPSRYQLQEWLNFISAEIRKGFAPLFKAAMPEQAKALFVEQLGQRFDVVERRLAQGDYLMGEHFSVADAYLFVTSNWAGYLGVKLDRWPAIGAFRARVASRPAVRAAMAAEGLKAAA